MYPKYRWYDYNEEYLHLPHVLNSDNRMRVEEKDFDIWDLVVSDYQSQSPKPNQFYTQGFEADLRTLYFDPELLLCDIPRLEPDHEIITDEKIFRVVGDNKKLYFKLLRAYAKGFIKPNTYFPTRKEAVEKFGAINYVLGMLVKLDYSIDYHYTDEIIDEVMNFVKTQPKPCDYELYASFLPSIWVFNDKVLWKSKVIPDISKELVQHVVKFKYYSENVLEKLFFTCKHNRIQSCELVDILVDNNYNESLLQLLIRNPNFKYILTED